MDKLPYDIYDRIAASLDGPDVERPKLATISRKWQLAIERQTFQDILLRSTNLNRFKQVVRGDRRRYVKKIEYIVLLPTYQDWERGRFEREDERNVNNESFTVAIHGLFQILKDWNVFKDGTFTLEIRDVYSTSDHKFLRHSDPLYCVGGDTINIKKPDQTTYGLDLQAWRFHYSYLLLQRLSALPSLPVVSSFRIWAITRKISPSSAFGMVKKLPNLQRLAVALKDSEIRYIEFRQSYRKELAEAILNNMSTLSRLEYFRLNTYNGVSWNPVWGARSLFPNNAPADPLSAAIGTVVANSKRLKEVDFNLCMDDALFLPSQSRALSVPYWYNLEHLQLMIPIRRPSGGSYFRNKEPIDDDPRILPPLLTQMPPGYGYSAEEDRLAASGFSLPEHREMDFAMHRCEVVPNDDALVPLLESFGRACLQMRDLKTATLVASIPSGLLLSNGETMYSTTMWGVWYIKRGCAARAMGQCLLGPEYSKAQDEGKILWTVGDWRPDFDLSRLLRSIGQEPKHRGPQLTEKFIELYYNPWKEFELNSWEERWGNRRAA